MLLLNTNHKVFCEMRKLCQKAGGNQHILGPESQLASRNLGPLGLVHLAMSWLVFALPSVLEQIVEVFNKFGHFSASPFRFPDPYLLSFFLNFLFYIGV